MRYIEKDWFETTFQERLLIVHEGVCFPERMDKNKTEFLLMIIGRLIDKTENMNDDEIEKFLGWD